MVRADGQSRPKNHEFESHLLMTQYFSAIFDTAQAVSPQSCGTQDHPGREARLEPAWAVLRGNEGCSGSSICSQTVQAGLEARLHVSQAEMPQSQSRSSLHC